MKTRLMPLIAALLLLPGCLTTTESIQVLADGSIRMEVVGDGDVTDLTEGYALPADAAWEPIGDQTRRWISEIGLDFGSKDAARRANASAWVRKKRERSSNVRLTFARVFESASDIDTTYAPASAPHASAYLVRSADLKIAERNGKKVYTFRRVLKRRDGVVDRIWDWTDDIGKALSDKIEEGESVTAKERDDVAQALSRSFRQSAAWYARTALAGIYTEGRGNLSLQARSDVMQTVAEEVGRLVPVETMREAVSLFEQDAEAKAAGQPSETAGPWLQAREQAVRKAIRDALRGRLVAAELPDATINGVVHRYEELLTATDHTHDLKDETFDFRIMMPGTIISGNFAEMESENIARWRFAGAGLVTGDIIIEVVSVVE